MPLQDQAVFKKTILGIVIIALMVLPGLALATSHCWPGQDINGVCLPAPPPGAPSNIETVSGLITRILDVALILVGLISVLFIVLGGYQYVTAGGDEEKLKNAKSRIVNALIGLAIVLLALAIVRIVANLTQGPSGV